VVVNQRAHIVVGSRHAEQEAWALAAAYQQAEVAEVAEEAARQAAAVLQSQSVDIATVESVAGPFLGPYRAAFDLVASADDIEALFGDSSDGDVVAPATTDEQVALMASFEMAHCKESTRQFMAAEWEALAAMLVVRANTAREAARVAVEEEAARVAARAAEATLELAAREESAVAEEAAREAARAVARAEELTEKAAAKAAA
jgi:hypothetical protein